MRYFSISIVSVGVLALAAFGDAARHSLRWDRHAVLAGEYWRLLTGHLIHLSLSHAVWNLAGAVFLYAVFRHIWSLREWIVVMAVALLGINIGLWWRTPLLDWYVGLSGVLHAVAAAALVPSLLARPLFRADPIAWCVALLGGAKLLYESMVGALPFIDEGVIITVHRDGAAAGLLCGTGLYLIRRAKSAST